MFTKRKSAVLATLVILTLVGFVSSAFAQTETGQIAGTVYDPSGAVVPNAKVTVKSATTALERQVTTSSGGTYAVTNLQPGRYTVSTEASGFSPVQQGVDVGVGQKVGVDIRMMVGGVSAAVEVVEAPAGLINTETQTLSQSVTGNEVLLLPTLTRNPYDLVQTVGNVSDGDPSGRGAGVAINGLRATSTNIMLDGVANNNEFAGDIGIRVPLDSVQEISVVTSDFTAEFGRAAGGIVNVATRSGSNDFHGTAYEFNRVSRLASNTFDNNANGITKPVFTRNQYGFSAGGPAIKNKLFFFENTEWTRVRSAQTQTAVIATPALIAASAPNTQQFFQSLGTPKPNLIPLQTFTRGAVNCTTGACTAIPATTPIYQKVAYSVPADAGGGSPQNTYALVGRVDYNPSDKNQMFFRMAYYHADFFVGTQTNSPYVGYDTADFQRNQGYVYSLTHTFAPTLISQSKVSYNRLSDLQPLGANPVGPTLYTTLSTTSTLGNSQIVYPGYSPYTPGNAVPFGGPQNFVAFNEDMSWTHGVHTVRFGGVYNYVQDNRAFGAYQEAVEALGTNTTTAVNGLITGQLHDFQAAVYPQGKFPCINNVASPDCTLSLPVGAPNFTRSNLFHESALYVQDSWQFKRRLTLNLGVRWEYFGPQANKDPNLDSNFYLGSGANIQQQSGNGKIMTTPNSPIGGLWKKDWNNFAPRVGFAWDVNGDGRTSLRGGYGIGFERNFNNVTFNVIQNPPNYGVIALTAGTDIPQIPVTTNNAGPLAGSSGTKTLPAVSVRGVDPNIKTAYAHTWSLAAEHSVASDVIVGLEYSGSRGQDLYTIDRLNMSASNRVYGPGPVAGSSRINPQYGLINFRTNGGDSIYHGLNTKVELRNLRKMGLTLRANYTWSHSIDDNSSTFTTDNAGAYNLGLLDPLNPKLDRGDSDFDVRHRMTLSAIWQEPFFSKKGLVNAIAGGWNVAPVMTFRTGTPFTVFDCTNEGSALCPRVMLTKPFNPSYTQTATSNPNEFNYLDFTPGGVNSDYVNPIAGISDFGPFPATMRGRNTFRTPGLWRFSTGVYKDFAITEKTKLQFRAEAYNLFNHSNLYLVYGNLDVSSFPGAPIVTATRGLRNDTTAYGTSVDNGRIENRNIQFALKLIF